MLIRNRQLAALVEDVEGTAEAPAAANAKLLVYEPRTNPTADFQTRDPVRGTLSKEGKLAGIKHASSTFRLELRGSGTATTAPAWSLLLRACGFQERTVTKLTIGAVTGGPFEHMEPISQATSGATGIVVIETANGTTTLYVIADKDSAAFDGTNLLTGGTSGATATPSASVAGGIAWNPFSKELSQVSIGAITGGPYTIGEVITGGTSGAKGIVHEATANGAAIIRYSVVPGTGAMASGEVITGGSSGATATTSSAATQSEVPSLTISAQDDLIRKVIKGARGTVKFTCRVGEAVFMEFDFMAVHSSITDQPRFAGVTHETTIPPLFLSASFTIQNFAAVISQLEIDMQVQRARRVDANDANGMIAARITGRDPVGTIDPETVQVASHDFFGKMFANTEGTLDFTVGSVTGNMFRFYARKVQYSGADDQDRDGIDTKNIPLDLNKHLGDGEDELFIIQL